jgi:hypothetical protein
MPRHNERKDHTRKKRRELIDDFLVSLEALLASWYLKMLEMKAELGPRKAGGRLVLPPGEPRLLLLFSMSQKQPTPSLA